MIFEHLRILNIVNLYFDIYIYEQIERTRYISY